MPALNFNRRFADAVKSGRKTQTVRRVWKNNRFPFRTGVPIYLYTAQRTRRSRRIGTATCTGTEPISISREDGVVLGNRKLTGAELEAFARADGFKNSSELFQFFDRPLDGYVIYWSLGDGGESTAAPGTDHLLTTGKD